jgi:hypothetical protein
MLTPPPRRVDLGRSRRACRLCSGIRPSSSNAHSWQCACATRWLGATARASGQGYASPAVGVTAALAAAPLDAAAAPLDAAAAPLDAAAAPLDAAVAPLDALARHSTRSRAAAQHDRRAACSTTVPRAAAAAAVAHARRAAPNGQPSARPR